MSNTRAQGQVAKAKELLVELEALDAAQATKLRDEMNARWTQHDATFEYVSSMISTLIDFVRQLRRDRAVKKQADVQAPVGWPTIPPGRYAVSTEEGHTAFYRVRVSPKGFTSVSLQTSSELHPLASTTTLAVLKKIEADGVKEAMVRYGLELGHCGAPRCGRPLTNPESIARGVGPKCWDKMGF